MRKGTVGNLGFVGVARGTLRGGCRWWRGGGVGEAGENSAVSLLLILVMLSGEEDV